MDRAKSGKRRILAGRERVGAVFVGHRHRTRRRLSLTLGLGVRRAVPPRRKHGLVDRARRSARYGHPGPRPDLLVPRLPTPGSRLGDDAVRGCRRWSPGTGHRWLRDAERGGDRTARRHRRPNLGPPVCSGARLVPHCRPGCLVLGARVAPEPLHRGDVPAPHGRHSASNRFALVGCGARRRARPLCPHSLLGRHPVRSCARADHVVAPGVEGAGDPGCRRRRRGCLRLGAVPRVRGWPGLGRSQDDPERGGQRGIALAKARWALQRPPLCGHPSRARGPRPRRLDVGSSARLSFWPS